ncbi:MAG: hypothetical protein ABFC77_05615 [Thermoguttaceae bacterium]
MRIHVWVGCTLLMALMACGDRAARAQTASGEREAACKAYQELLAMFPEDRQGYGKDHYRSRVDHQPMTYGLVLSAEAAHLKSAPNDESRRRVRLAARWLLDNRDLDGDGLPGWGLPQDYVASDGLKMPPNHPYTVTTAIVLDGLLDALNAPADWSDAERKEIRSVMVQVVLRWCRHVWSEGYGGGYFWYNPRRDHAFCLNASSMFGGAMVRLLKEHGDAMTAEERRLIEDRTDQQAKAVVASVNLWHGMPYWHYAAQPNKLNFTHPNDLLHHVYTLWGIELYRDCGGRVPLPWTRAQAVQSMERFWHDGQICPLPPKTVSATAKPLRLWDTGTMLAFYAKWGEPRQAQQAFEFIHEKCGPWPNLRLFPTEKPTDESFYPRHAAHVLFGLALYCYPQ